MFNTLSVGNNGSVISARDQRLEKMSCALGRASLLFDLAEAGQDGVVEWAIGPVLAQVGPADDAAGVDDKRRGPGHIAFQDLEAFDHLMIGVGQKRERKAKLGRHIAALGGRIDANSQHLSASGLEFVVVGGHTGQLRAAVCSPVPPVEYQDELRFAREV